MLRFIVGIFIVLHGLVHLLYFGQSQRLFELEPGMVWPDGSWAFSKLLGEGATRTLASLACVVAALGFVVGGAGILVRQTWWRPAVVAVTVFSAGVLLLFWDGKVQALDNKGGVGVMINIVILVALLLLRWPDLGF